ncbi:MAG TPA: hypothetical protein VFL76_06280 [Edaphocola sp.]|nr:hypothetical protein [Edaphocola sp.]
MAINTHTKLKRPVRLVLGLGLCTLFIALVVLAFAHQENKVIRKTELHVVNQNRMGVLQKKTLESWIFKNPQINVSGKSKDKLDLKKIEQQAELNPWVANAEVYVDNDDVLQIDIAERYPLARIFRFDGLSFYMDSSLAKMPVIKGSSFAIPVFTNVVYGGSDSLNRALNAKIAFMAELIGKDSFWNAQIEQIVVQPDQDFVLIPLLGKDQQIIFGDTSNAREKLDNLFAFYTHVIPKIGWDNYRRIDLRFSGQIVAAPTLNVTLAKPEDPLEQSTLERKDDHKKI